MTKVAIVWPIVLVLFFVAVHGQTLSTFLFHSLFEVFISRARASQASSKM